MKMKTTDDLAGCIVDGKCLFCSNSLADAVLLQCWQLSGVYAGYAYRQYGFAKKDAEDGTVLVPLWVRHLSFYNMDGIEESGDIWKEHCCHMDRPDESCPVCGRTFDPEGEVLYDMEGRVYEGEDYD